MSRLTVLATIALAAWIAMPDSADARSRHSRGLLAGPFRLLLSPLRGRHVYAHQGGGRRLVARRRPAAPAMAGLIAAPVTSGAIAAPAGVGVIASPAPAVPMAA